MIAFVRKIARTTMAPFSSQRQASFTLIETMVALGILVVVMAEIMGVQSNAVFFGEYSRRSIQASWLAQRVMGQVEYYWRTKDFKEMAFEQEDLRFDAIDQAQDLSQFTYNLSIVEWKLPLVELLTGGGPSAEDEEGQTTPSDGTSEMISGVIKQVLGDDLMRVAYVEVFWPEGARRNSESLTLLLTNQRKVDETIATLKSTYDKMRPTATNEPNGSDNSKPRSSPDRRTDPPQGNDGA